MIETDILTALLDRCNEVAALTALPVAMPNRVFEVPANGRYLEVKHFPNTPLDPTWGRDQVRIGFLQINVVWNVDDGPINAMNVCGTITAYFLKGTEIRSGAAIVKIEPNPVVMSVIQDGQKATFPVSIPYRCPS